MASSSWCRETDGKVNYTRLCRLLVDGGTQAVRSVFDGIHPPSSLKAILNTNKATLQTLKKPRGRVLNDDQWDKLYPASGNDPKSEDFDITLLVVLLRNICGLTPPVYEITGSGKRKRSWDKLPHKTDNSKEANLVRIKYYRNNTVAHKPNTEINDADFEQHWQDISSALLSLGLSQDDIDDLKSAPLGKKDYKQLLYDWYISDKDVRTQLDGVKSDTADLKSDTADLKSDTADLKSDTADLKSDTADLKSDTADLKSDTADLKSDTADLKLDTADLKSDTADLKSDTADLKSDTADLKSDTADLKSDAADIKSNTGLIPVIQEDISQLKNIYSTGSCFENQHISQLANSEFNSLIESLCKSFHPNTRQWILHEIKSHVCEGKTCGTLITAGPGMGKSTIAAKICQTYKDLGCLAGCHFFQFSNSTRNNPRLMLQSIARQMCDTVPGYGEILESKLGSNLGKKISEMNCEELFTVLLEEPLQKLKKTKDSSFVVVLDAIDECCSDLKQELVHVLKSKLSLLPVWLKFVITSRPSIFKLEKYLDIDPNNPQNVSDLELFFTSELKQLHGNRDPHPSLIHLLVKISEGLFLVAFFLADYLKTHKIESPKELVELFPNGISSVYENYFSRLKEVLLPYISEEERFYKMLEAVVATNNPLPKNMFYTILGLKSDEDIPRTKKQGRQDALNSLHLLFPMMYDHVTAFHKSVLDWLTLENDKTHNFSVRRENGFKVLVIQCHNVLRDIRNGSKDLDKPLVLNDDEKFSLNYGSDTLHLNFTTNELSRSFANYFILSALICSMEVGIRRYSFLPYMLPGFSEEMNDIFSRGVQLFNHQLKCSGGCQGMTQGFASLLMKHDESCPFLIPANFGQCVEFTVNAIKQVFKQFAPITLLLLRRFRLSYIEVKDIAVELEDVEGLPDVSVIPCGRGFLLVQETEHNTVVKKYLLDGTCLAKKAFPGTNHMLCMSTDHRNIVVTNLSEKGNIGILDAKTLDLVTSYQSPADSIKSCHVYGGQPWYIVIRCFNNMIHVMEGETGKLVQTYASQVNKYMDIQAVGNQGHVLLGRQYLTQHISKDDADAFFMNEDGKLLEDNYGVPVALDRVHLKHLLFHLESHDCNIPIYPASKSRLGYCNCMANNPFFISAQSPLNSIAFLFSYNGLLFAYSDGGSVFIINTSDGTLHKRVWLGPGFKMLSVDGILFVSQTLLVVQDIMMILFIDVQTNEIKHRFYEPSLCEEILYPLPKQEGHPFTMLTQCFTSDKCVQQIVFHNLDF